ncbi:hypothetical protein [Deinococcus sp.]|uniref:hypothetical protein n=1 Tax=Deinococcus sp. TaxID=47478 RepID=UPI0025EBDA8E|nr:hypothetical protein [Deinococcus sp.]
MRTEPPPDARLGLYRHGDTVSEKAALELAGRPDFPASWLIVPSPDGERLSLMWGDACTTAELSRSSVWNTMQRATIQAARHHSGEA